MQIKIDALKCIIYTILVTAMNYKSATASPVHASSNSFPLEKCSVITKRLPSYLPQSHPVQTNCNSWENHTSQIMGIWDSQKSKEHSRTWHQLRLNLRLTGLLLLQLLDLFQCKKSSYLRYAPVRKILVSVLDEPYSTPLFLMFLMPVPQESTCDH